MPDIQSKVTELAQDLEEQATAALGMATRNDQRRRGRDREEREAGLRARASLLGDIAKRLRAIGSQP